MRNLSHIHYINAYGRHFDISDYCIQCTKCIAYKLKLMTLVLHLLYKRLLSKTLIFYSENLQIIVSYMD